MSYFGKHISLSDWLQRAQLKSSSNIIDEDSTKRERLQLLSFLIGLPIVQSFKYSYEEFIGPNCDLNKILKDEKVLYAVRLNPNDSNKPILRNRGLAFEQLIKWIYSIKNLFDYEIQIERHVEAISSTIFVVEKNKIIGEVIQGSLVQLVEGLSFVNKINYFECKNDRWNFSNDSTFENLFVFNSIKYLKLNAEKASLINDSGLDHLDAGNIYLPGYFEVILSKDNEVFFVDYNRVLGKTLLEYSVFSSKKEDISLVKGIGSSKGVAKGRAFVIKEDVLNNIKLSKENILICKYTSPEYIDLMISAAGVITEQGGLLSHASIVCRELNIPCIIGVEDITRKIETGNLIEMDGSLGIINIQTP